MTKIIMHGYKGRMGQTIIKLASNDEICEVVAGIDMSCEGGQNEPFPVYSDIMDCDMKADVIIDFSHQSAVDKLIDYAVLNNIAVVVCTTALKEETLTKIEEASKKIPIFKSANMSLGVNLIANILNKISKTLYDENFDIEILEKHHNQKLDAPSGTAMLLADSINKSLDNSLSYVYERASVLEKRKRNEIGISAIRGGTIIGEHSVIFAGKDEVIEFNHTAFSKEVFAVGALKAAKFIFDKQPGIYDMNDMLSDIV